MNHESANYTDGADYILKSTKQVINFEAIVLHGIIFQGKIPEIEINPEDFIDNRNKQIYKVILDCFEKGLRPDFVNISDLWLEKSKKDKNYIYDLDYIFQLQYVPDISDVTYALLRLQYYARERAVSRILDEKKQSGDLDVSELIIELEKLETTETTSTPEELAVKVYENLLKKQSGDLKTFKSGFRGLDTITGGFVGGEYIIIAGRTSQGKTACALSIIYSQCIIKEHAGAIITVEMSDEQLLNRLCTMQTGVPISALKTGDVNEWQLAEVRDFLELFTKRKIIINHAVRLNIAELRRRVKGFIKQGAEFVILDYIQKLSHKAASREQEISKISEACKNLAMEYNVPFIVLAQLNRAAELMDIEPELSHLRESGSLEQDADIVIFVHRKKDETGEDIVPARLLMKKNRNGATGSVDIEFQKSRAIFRDKQI